jgi:hypothetical protein
MLLTGDIEGNNIGFVSGIDYFYYKNYLLSYFLKLFINGFISFYNATGYSNLNNPELLCVKLCC